jgi:hypothetical protein
MNYKLKYRAFGECGSPGGNAGQGGSGGVRGLTGVILFMENESHSFIESKSLGVDGVDGSHGNPGTGGERGQTVEKIFKYHKTIFKTTEEWDESSKKYYDIVEKNCNNNGNIPEGKNSQSRILPTNTPQNFYDADTEYIKFLTEMNLKFKNNKLLERNFLKSLMKRNNFIKPNIKSLIERTRILNSFEHLNLLLVLQKEITDHLNASVQFSERLVFRYILTAVKSLITRYESQESSSLVVDVKSYLKNTKDVIQKWTSLIREDVRKIYKDNFEKNLKLKIEESVQFKQKTSTSFR